MNRSIAFCAVAALAIAGCRKSAAPKPPSLSAAYAKLQAAYWPPDFEWPLKQLAKVAAQSDQRDARLAARFEQSRGLLRLVILSDVPREAEVAHQVLTRLGMRQPADVIERIAAGFDVVAKADDLKDPPLARWAADGARLVRAITAKADPMAGRRDLVAIALGGGVFSAEATAVIFVRLVRLVVAPPPAPESKLKAAPRGKLSDLLEFACPGGVEAWKTGVTDKAASADPNAALATSCMAEPWAAGRKPADIVAASPCKGLPLAGPDAGTTALRTAVAAFLTTVLSAYQKGGEGGRPAVVYRRFPADGACAIVEGALGAIDRNGSLASPAGSPPPAAGDKRGATPPTGPAPAPVQPTAPVPAGGTPPTGGTPPAARPEPTADPAGATTARPPGSTAPAADEHGVERGKAGVEAPGMDVHGTVRPIFPIEPPAPPPKPKPR